MEISKRSQRQKGAENTFHGSSVAAVITWANKEIQKAKKEIQKTSILWSPLIDEGGKTSLKNLQLKTAIVTNSHLLKKAHRVNNLRKL